MVAGRTSMQYPSWRLWSVLVSALAIPVVFVGVLYIWAKIDESLGSREVSQFISQQRRAFQQSGLRSFGHGRGHEGIGASRERSDRVSCSGNIFHTASPMAYLPYAARLPAPNRGY
jgi:hypothetical protein